MKPYLVFLPKEEGRDRASFDLYLPAGEGGDLFTVYHFAYEVNDKKPTLGFAEGPNDPANRRHYRIRTAEIVRREGEIFHPISDALRGGEVGLAIHEEGAGDYVGGLHGDEVLSEVSLSVAGKEIPLDGDFCGEAEGFVFREVSTLYRCNTPELPLARHEAAFTVEGCRLLLSQRVEWLTEALPPVTAFMPMLTAPRIDMRDQASVLTDTIDFFDEGGHRIATYDTTPYGADPPEGLPTHLGKGTQATVAHIYKKDGGLSVLGGYTSPDGSIPKEQRASSIWIRFGGAKDSKVYFKVSEGARPTAGTVWQSEIFYEITFKKA